MEKSNFKIKIADLFFEIGKKDRVNFEKKFSKQLPNIHSEGIKGKVTLQSLDKKTILVEFEEIKTYIKDTCDICGKDFEREVIIKNYQAKFMLPEVHHDITEEIHDDEHLINEKDETIDIEEMLVQSILLEEPMVKKCNECSQNYNPEDDNSEENNSLNRINWINVKKK